MKTPTLTVPEVEVLAATAVVLSAEQQTWLIGKADQYGLATVLSLNSDIAEACMDRGMNTDAAINELMDCAEFQTAETNALLKEVKVEHATPGCAFGLDLTMELEERFPVLFA